MCTSIDCGTSPEHLTVQCIKRSRFQKVTWSRCIVLVYTWLDSYLLDGFMGWKRRRNEIAMVDTMYNVNVCMIVPFDLRISADKEQQVCPSGILKQQHSAAVQQTLIHLLGESSIARTILWDSLLACWMT